MTPTVETVALRKLYGNVAILDGVTFSIAPGELVAVEGPSGSGKSTLLNLIAGLDPPTEGSVLIDGVDLAQLYETQRARLRRERIGLVFQFFHLLDKLTVLQNVMVPAELAGHRLKDAQERARGLLAQLGLTSRADAYPANLSGGEQQKVALARALVNRPRLLLADEPTGALDSHTGQQVLELLVELNQAGQTLLLVTHDREVAAQAHRVISLRDGRIVDDTVLGPRPPTEPSKLLQDDHPVGPQTSPPPNGGGRGPGPAGRR
jgi:putative ABC transport system ATP-binding protein